MAEEYSWQKAYVAAALETDDLALARRIEEARRVLDARILQIPLGSDTEAERRAIADALYALRALSLER